MLGHAPVLSGACRCATVTAIDRFFVQFMNNNNNNTNNNYLTFVVTRGLETVQTTIMQPCTLAYS
jgi:hypothetical protein